MNLTGTIEITANWAQLDLDPDQANEGIVILMRPMGAGATDADRIDAGYQYFDGQQGIHYTLTGQFQQAGDLNYLLVTNAVKG
jgi:hypothetical protein